MPGQPRSSNDPKAKIKLPLLLLRIAALGETTHGETNLGEFGRCADTDSPLVIDEHCHPGANSPNRGECSVYLLGSDGVATFLQA